MAAHVAASFDRFLILVLPSVLVLLLLIGLGVVAIVRIRAARAGSGEDRGDWEKTLADYKNLRDAGVLSPEEYRKIRTRVEPRLRIGIPGLPRRQRPSLGDRPGPDIQRT